MAAGFPRRRPSPRGAASDLLARLRAVPPRRVLAPAGAVAVAAIAVSTAVIAISGGDRSGPVVTGLAPQHSPSAQAGGRAGSEGHRYEGATRASSAAGAASTESGASTAESGSSAAEFEESVPARSGGYASGTGHRDVERGAQIVLGTEPTEVRDAAAQVFDAVHAARGIVLNSSIRDGSAGHAGARFELLIPTAKLSDAMASFSSIANVVSRRESTLDITAPTISAGEALQDSRARIESLLAELAGTETASERAAVEAELHATRREAAAQRSQLSALRRRANLSHVSLRIETRDGATTEGGGAGWGVGDGLDNAGRILAIAAGVLVIGLAVLAPVALLLLLAWLAHRAYIRRARTKALT